MLRPILTIILIGSIWLACVASDPEKQFEGDLLEQNKDEGNKAAGMDAVIGSPDLNDQASNDMGNPVRGSLNQDAFSQQVKSLFQAHANQKPVLVIEFHSHESIESLFKTGPSLNPLLEQATKIPFIAIFNLRSLIDYIDSHGGDPVLPLRSKIFLGLFWDEYSVPLDARYGVVSKSIKILKNISRNSVFYYRSENLADQKADVININSCEGILVNHKHGFDYAFPLVELPSQRHSFFSVVPKPMTYGQSSGENQWPVDEEPSVSVEIIPEERPSQFENERGIYASQEVGGGILYIKASSKNFSESTLAELIATVQLELESSGGNWYLPYQNRVQSLIGPQNFAHSVSAVNCEIKNKRISKAESWRWGKQSKKHLTQNQLQGLPCLLPGTTEESISDLKPLGNPREWNCSDSEDSLTNEQTWRCRESGKMLVKCHNGIPYARTCSCIEQPDGCNDICYHEMVLFGF